MLRWISMDLLRIKGIHEGDIHQKEKKKPDCKPMATKPDVISGQSRDDPFENSLGGSLSMECIHVGNQLHVWMWIYGEENLEKPPVTDLKTGLVYLGRNSSWNSSWDSDQKSDRHLLTDSVWDSSRDSVRYRPWRRIPHIGCFLPNPAGSCWCPPSEMEVIPKCGEKERFMSFSDVFRDFWNFWDISSSDDESGFYWMYFPPALSIMINFGLGDDTDILVDTDDWLDMCGPGLIWDPFGNFCREVYCDDDYELQGSECVQGEFDAPDDIFTIHTQEVVVLLDVEAIGHEDRWIVEEFQQHIPTELGSHLNISASRILNLSLAIPSDCKRPNVSDSDVCQRSLSVRFVLVAGDDLSEQTVDSAVAQMTYEITRGKFFLVVFEIALSVQGIHEYPTDDSYRHFQEWCR